MNAAETLVVDVAFDGGCRGNPGPAAAAAIVRDAAGVTLRHIGVAIDRATNNVAEWTGLLIGLELARDLGATEVRIFGDSKLVIDQFNGACSIHEPTLREIALKASRVARTFKMVSAQHVRRQFNAPADAICNAVLDGTYAADGALPEAGGAIVQGALRVAYMVEVEISAADVERKLKLGMSRPEIRAELDRSVNSRVRMAAAIETGPNCRAKVEVNRLKG